MKPEELKSKSRGVSRDMSPEAISRRFDILVELHELASALSSAKRLGRAQALSTSSKPPEGPPK